MTSWVNPAASFYYTDAINDGVHIWPGWSTNGISDSLAQGSVKFIVKPHSLPEGASAHVFNSDALTGKVEHIFNTSTSLSDAASALNTAANTSTTAFSSARESVFSSSLPQVSSSLYNMDRLSGTLAVTISNQNQQITQLKSMLTQLDKNLAATQSALNQSDHHL